MPSFHCLQRANSMRLFRIFALCWAIVSPIATSSSCIGHEDFNSFLNESNLPNSIRMASVDMCPTVGSVFINVGGKNLGNGYRCDVGNFVSGPSFIYESEAPIDFSRPCKEQYRSHRWPPGGADLTYTLPVASGSYKVVLGFMETYQLATKDFRKFTVYINDKKVHVSGLPIPLDVFAEVGVNKPFNIDCGSWPSVNGKIKIELDRFVNSNNPMLSAIGIIGPGADAIIGNLGLNSCDPNDNSLLKSTPSEPKEPESKSKPVKEDVKQTESETPKPEPVKEEPEPEPEPKIPTPKPEPKATTPTPEPEPKSKAPTPEPVQTGQVNKFDGCPKPGSVFINAGGSNMDNGYRCDNGAFSSKPSLTFATKDTSGINGKCDMALQSHRFATGGKSLAYSIPVPPGTYKVYLMFAEVWKGAKKGTRLFTVQVNKKSVVDGSLDVFEKVGHNKMFVIEAGEFSPLEGHIKIDLGRVQGKNNPFISAIGIVGAGADGIVKDFGLKSCTLEKFVTPNGEEPKEPEPKIPTKEECSAKDGPATTNFADFHLAHAVSGGPYVETDFKKEGKAEVALDGERSHSHATDPSVGVITEYNWSWKDTSNPSADSKGIVTVSGPKPKPPPKFPLGLTELTLEVQDQFCNKAVEKTIVTINPSTKPGAYCYYYSFGNNNPTSFPIPQDIKSGPRPEFGTEVGDINFGNTRSFGDFKFIDEAFAVRCVFSIQVENTGEIVHEVEHSGLMQVYYDNVLVGESKTNDPSQTTSVTPLMFHAGLHHWQILYFKPKNKNGLLKFKVKDGPVIPANIVRHDAASTLPVITRVSKTEALVGDFVTIFGSAFVNDVMVKFGDEMGQPVENSAGTIVLRVPKNPKKTVVITVHTEAGVSNGITFQYSEAKVACEKLAFKKDNLKSINGGTLKIKDIAVLRYGPDGRLYLGSQRSKIHALTIDQDLKVTKTCTKDVKENGLRRWILGIAFDPHTTELKMFFTSNTFNWKKLGLIHDFGKGWTNGKVQSVTLSNEKACFNDDVTDVVTGLPVTNHDHGINFIDFLPDGRLLIAVGGFTNGGVTHPKDALGGIPPAPLAGALITCPKSGSFMKYSNLQKPDEAEVVEGQCVVYAAGLRNTFSGTQHTNGELYVTDNGPNLGFGEFSLNCNGGKFGAANIPDKLFKVNAKPGNCHGHPHLPRGKSDPRQCVFNSPDCTQALLEGLTSSTNGVIEYRSNLFAQKLKGNLLLTRFSDSQGKKGRITRVQLNSAGNLAPNGVTNIFSDDSGLSIVEGPRGELICSRVFKDTFFLLRPTCDDDTPSTPYFIGVHPKRGPASGGHQVLISGFGFGNNPSASFDGKPCIQTKVINEKAFTCVTPKGKPQAKVKVIVTTDGGQNFATEGSDYWYW